MIIIKIAIWNEESNILAKKNLISFEFLVERTM